MDEELSRISSRTCCRLCLAPDNECVPIFTNSAADNEPLSFKIQACVNIKVQEADRLSSRICHSCISYLNSWQSFKNRCMNSQKKQKTWLMLMTEKDKEQQQQVLARMQLQQMHSNIITYDNFSNNKRKRVHLNRNDFVWKKTIKLEPESEDNDEEQTSGMIDDPVSLKMELDPSQFLAPNYEDEEYPVDGDLIDVPPLPIMAMEEGPPILTSLGLTHINHVNPYNFLSTEHEFPDESLNEDDNSALYNNMQPNQKRRLTPVPAACSICDMKFSNRANARRHERNIHGVILNPMSVQLANTAASTSTPNPRSVAQKKIVQLPEIIDYDNPQKYRNLLTEHKLAFMRKNIAFMEQYQDMTCICCDRQFQTYKAFMSHMRKKYHNLPRNLCFKCLKQFETKGQFIAHLKKKNCINLHKIYMGDETIEKPDASNLSLEESARVGTKEIIANKVYGCKLCTQTFRLKMDFRAHVYEAHADEQKSKDITGAACAFCNAEFDEPVLRRRHYNNLECIIFLICGTCDEKFETHAQYIEHVYQAHLTNLPSATGSKTISDNVDAVSDEFDGTNVSPSTSLRTPQNCAVCGKQYNNYYNVLRHMESKHPDQLPSTYQCETCKCGFPRQSELREHIKKSHPDVVMRSTPIKGTFTCNECGCISDTKDLWIEHMMIHSKFVCHECDYKTESKEEFEVHLMTHLKLKLYSCTLCKHSYNTEKGLEQHMTAIHNNPNKSTQSSVSDGRNGETKSELTNKIDEIKKDNFKLKTDEVSLLVPLPTNTSNTERTKTSKRENGDHHSSKDGGGVNELILPKQRECPICKAIFNAGVAFSNHMRTHMITNTSLNHSGQSKTTSGGGGTQTYSRLRCRICQKRINTKLGLKRHMLLAHQIRNQTFVKCYMCSAEFSNHKGLRVHLFRAHQITKIEDEQQPVVVTTEQQQTPVLSNIRSILPKNEMKHFECDICHTVYRNLQDLKVHNTSVHGYDSFTDENNKQTPQLKPIVQPIINNDEIVIIPKFPISSEIWFQCRYCNDTFNSSKKLTIHMNTHDEHDQSDYSCKDCGNVYATRKSLWVHRYKKHPRPPNPIICEICKKVFFDKTELYYHLKTHSQLQQQQQQNLTYIEQQQLQLQQQHQTRHKVDDISIVELNNDNNNDDGDDDNNIFAEEQLIQLQQQQQQHLQQQQKQLQKQQRQQTVGQYSCHVCGQKFHDKGVLSKHLRIHEMQNNMFINSSIMPGSGGFDTGISDYKLSYQDNMINGEYACDLCPKTFPILNALHVHRGWHFRSPSGRQVTEPGNTWQPDSIPPSKLRRMKNPYGSPPVCPYCNSTFASTNNLRRHIVEVHKRNEAKLMREKDSDNQNVFIEKVKECQTCNITFNTITEWIDHKIIHARNQKPSTTFEWGCEICGKMFTRKERLLQHMITHLSSREFDTDGTRIININNTNDNSIDQSMGGDSEMNFGESNSQTSQSSMNSLQDNVNTEMNQHIQRTIPKEELDHDDNDDHDDNEDGGDDDNHEQQYQVNAEVDEDEDEDEDEDDDENENEDEAVDDEDDDEQQQQQQQQEDDEDNDDDDDEDDEEEEEDDVDDDDNSSEHSNETGGTYACELCLMNFNNTKELRSHVAHHILNGAGQSPTSVQPIQSSSSTTTTASTKITAAAANNFKDITTTTTKNTRNKSNSSPSSSSSTSSSTKKNSINIF